MNQTGYFAKQPKVSWGICRATKVNFLENGRPICVYKPAEGYQFQWCAAFYHLPYLECSKCRKVYEKQLKIDAAGGDKLKFPVTKTVRMEAKNPTTELESWKACAEMFDRGSPNAPSYFKKLTEKYCIP